MTTEGSDTLHLPDLRISGFRGFNELCIPKLGRVNLFAGKNGVGKTSVLEAVQVYSESGNGDLLLSLLSKHEEFATRIDDEDEMDSVIDPSSLFYNRKVSLDSIISIESLKSERISPLKIKWTKPKVEQSQLSDEEFEDFIPKYYILSVSFAGENREIPWITASEIGSTNRSILYGNSRRRYSDKRNFFYEERRWQGRWQGAINCISLGPDILSKNRSATFFDYAIENGDEPRVIDAIQLVLENEVEWLRKVGETRATSRSSGPRIIVKLSGQEKTVPLNSLGDGASRLFGVAAALASARDGLLLIDEAENGIHHTVQNDFWRIIFKMAIDNNIQVFATTHSLDCVKGFAQAALESKDEEGVLVRLDRDRDVDGLVHAAIYAEDKLESAAKNGIEMR